MSRQIIFLLVLSLSLMGSLAEAQNTKKEKAAVTAAEQWLLLVDEGKYDQSWREAAEYFKNAVSQDEWHQSLQAVRSPLGKLVSRKVKTQVYKTSLPGAPDGEYVVIQFETSFKKKKAAVETVTPMMDEDDVWRVSGYYIK
jgi:hypothetical protein